MATTTLASVEAMRELAKQLEAQLAEARTTIEKMQKLPIDEFTRAARQNFGDAASAFRAMMKVSEALTTLARIVGQSSAEAETIAIVTDDVIGRSGRLF